jgi:hypothetical protein
MDDFTTLKDAAFHHAADAPPQPLFPEGASLAADASS